MAIVAASQVATLDAWGPGTGGEALRGSVRAGNEVLLRTKSASTKTVMNSGGVDPTTFPRIPGYAYLLDDTGTRRSAPLRGYYLDDETRDRAARQVSWPELDPASAAAAGPTYQRRRELLDAAQQALAAKIAALTGQTPATDRALEAAPAAAVASAQVPVPQFPPLPNNPPTTELEPPPARVAVADRPATATADRPATAADAVAQLLQEGVTSPGEMERRTGYSETAVRKALQQLQEQGRARRVRHGVWEAT